MDNNSAQSTTENPVKTKTALNRLLTWHKWGLYVPLLVLVIFLGYSTWMLYSEPTSKVEHVFISNATDHQATVSWTTSKATKGAILILKDNKFPLFPFLAGNSLVKDDGEKSLKISRSFTTHHVTLTKLEPGTIYNYRIYQGWRMVSEGKLATGPSLATLLSPNPVYGKVLSRDGKTPVVGALVYLFVGREGSNSATLSTLTNLQGNWELDMANLRTADLKQTYPFNPKSALPEKVIVDAGAKGRVKAASEPGKDKPWPNILLGKL